MSTRRRPGSSLSSSRSGRTARPAGCWPKTRPHIFAFRPGRELAAVRVKLEWTAPLLDLEPADHVDAERDLASVLPKLLAELLEPLAETSRRVPAWTPKEHDADWDYIVRVVVERAWRGVRGQG